MASKKVITIFGSTGNQGGNVVDIFFSHPEISTKYQLRGITRNKTSVKSKKLESRGVEMVEANVDDASSIQAAVKGAYGVFAMTDYWSILDKAREIKQGKTIFDSCKAAGVQHLVWSSLPNVSKLSKGKYIGVKHFDSKAEVEEYAETNKGSMIVSYFMPAMFMDVVKQITQEADGSLSISLPYPDQNIPWPLLSPSRDTGKWVVGLFEAGQAANGVEVQGVSAWTTPKEVIEVLQKGTGKKAQFDSVEPKVYESYLPENVREDTSDMMQWIGESSYYGKGTQEKQAESNKWLVDGAQLTSWAKFVELEY